MSFSFLIFLKLLNSRRGILISQRKCEVLGPMIFDLADPDCENDGDPAVYHFHSDRCERQVLAKMLSVVR
jgi:hypothetical protein